MQALRLARPSVIIAVGWLVLLIYAYPGQMVESSFEALRQARSPFFAPENPPGWSAMWRWIELAFAGPFPMFIAQTAAFAIGAFLILRRAMTERAAAFATAGLLVFPPLTVPLSVIWSHSLMAGLLALGTAALLSERRRVHLAGLVLLLLATVAQPHALLATLPLTLALARVRPDAVGVRRITHAALAWGVLTGGGLALTKHYSKKPSAPLWSYVKPVHDTEWQPVPPRALPDNALKLGVSTRTTAIQDGWTDALTSLADHTPLFSPWLYLILALALVPLSLRDPARVALLVGGVMTFLAYRNPVWVGAAACIAAAVTIAERLRR
jgi:hypothetical protein